MAIPDFQTIMLPILRHLEDGRERGNQDTLDHLARHFGLTENELAQLLPSRLLKNPRFRDRAFSLVIF